MSGTFIFTLTFELDDGTLIVKRGNDEEHVMQLLNLAPTLGVPVEDHVDATHKTTLIYPWHRVRRIKREAEFYDSSPGA